MTVKLRFQVSPDVEKCTDYLKEQAIGDLVTYSAISSAIGRDVGGRDRYVLASARKRLEAAGMVFVVETGKGLRRADDAQVASLSTDVPVTRTKRIARMARKRQRIVNVQNLSDKERAEFYVGRAILGGIEQAVRGAVRNKLNAIVNETGEMPSMEKTMELFRKVRRKQG